MLQRNFILHPKKLQKTYQFRFDFNFEELNFATPDGDLNAFHARTDSPKGVIVYFHGNADNLVRWGEYSKEFLDRGYDVIMMDYRGFGKSDGRATEANMYTDGQTLYDYALQHYNSQNIIVYGRSLGTGVATHIASKNKLNRLILETPFYSIPDVVQEKYPFILQLFQLNFEFPNHVNIDNIDVPIDIFHGTKDRIIPLSSAEKLNAHLAEKDHFLVIEGGGHKNLGTYQAFQNRLSLILD